MERMNLIKISHRVRVDGMTAYRQLMLEQAAKINELQEAVEELQKLVSDEMMGGLVKPSELSDVVAELGAGWQIVRQPAANPDPTTTAGTPAETWLPGSESDWVIEFAAADGK
jgi:hypothetical protein